MPRFSEGAQDGEVWKMLDGGGQEGGKLGSEVDREEERGVLGGRLGRGSEGSGGWIKLREEEGHLYTRTVTC